MESTFSEKSTWRQAQPWVAGLGVAVISGLAVWAWVQQPAPPIVRATVPLDESASLFVAVVSPDIAISPDGGRIAYGTGEVGFGAAQLHVRSLTQDASEVVVNEGSLNAPFFSSDGESLGFYDRSAVPFSLKRVSSGGGTVATICELPGSGTTFHGATWGDDGTIVFSAAGLLWQVSALGGEPETLTPSGGGGPHRWPEFLPGGRAVLYTVFTDVESSSIAVVSLDTLESKVVIPRGSYPRYSVTGHLLFGVEGDLWAVRFDPDRLEVVGEPVPVQESVVIKTDGAMDVDLANDGSLIYVSGVYGDASRTLVWVDRQGSVAEEIPAVPARYESPRISPDGQHVALELDGDVVVYDLERNTPSRLTLDTGTDERHPRWTVDSQRVVFSSDRDGLPKIYSRAADGTGQAALLVESNNELWPESWSPDGQTLLVREFIETDNSDVSLMSLEAEGELETLIGTEFEEFYSEVSPDGRWIAYHSTESGVYHVYVRPFPNVDESRWQISRESATSPRWGPDGRELFYRSLTQPRSIMAVEVQTEPSFRVGTPQVLFSMQGFLGGLPARSRPWDVGEDGRFLMLREQSTVAGDVDAINLVLNWHTELLDRVPIN